MYDTALFQSQLHTTILIWLAAGWLLWLPGTLLASLFGLRRSPDVLVYVALQLGLGIVFWPLLFLWTSTLGFRWSPAVAQIVVFVVGLGGIFVLARPGYNLLAAGRQRFPRFNLWLLLFGLIATLTVVTRLLHIRNLVLPAWVDSVYHTMIVRVLLAQGALPDTYAPFIPHGHFFHHWGYHSLAAWLAWFLGLTDPLDTARLILQFGQVLNTLSVVMFYAAGRTLFNSRRAGLLAAMIGTLISWLPAYYVTWGHYSKLTGLLVLPVFCIALWQLHKRPSIGIWLAAVMLGAGLLTIHVRVVVLALTLITVLGFVLLFQRVWRTLLLWGLVGLAVIFLDLPWLFILLNNSYLLQVFSQTSDLQSTQWIDLTSIPWHLVWITHNRELLALITGGVSGLAGWGNMPLAGRVISGLWLLLLGALFVRVWRNKSFHYANITPFALLLAWAALTAVVLNLSHLGLPALRFVDNFTGVIVLFIPLSLIGGGLLAWVSRQMVPRRRLSAVTAVLIVAGSVWGAMTMTNIVKLTSILIQPADVRAMGWIQENTPPEAHFAVNVWPWLPGIYAGTDGGYWLPLLTDRTSVLPPAIIYPIASDYDTFQSTNALLEPLSQPRSLNNADFRARLKRNGVTHLYIGARGGPLDPLDLLNRSFVELVYHDGPVYIFKLVSN